MTCWWLPHWGGITMQRISFTWMREYRVSDYIKAFQGGKGVRSPFQSTGLTWGLSGGETPYMYPAICVLRSAMQMNFFRRFLGMT